MEHKSSERQASKTPSTEVEIFGAVYHVRGREDRAYLQGLARTVDRKMREISDQVATVDTAKIAILAALNLADELSRCQTEQGGREGIDEIKEKVATLAEELTDALES